MTPGWPRRIAVTLALAAALAMVWLLAILLAIEWLAPVSAASKSPGPCVVDANIDRVYTRRAYGDNFPAVMVTLSHQCQRTYSWILINCTWLHDNKPVALSRKMFTNVQSGVPATEIISAHDAPGRDFDSARCRIAGSDP